MGKCGTGGKIKCGFNIEIKKGGEGATTLAKIYIHFFFKKKVHDFNSVHNVLLYLAVGVRGGNTAGYYTGVHTAIAVALRVYVRVHLPIRWQKISNKTWKGVSLFLSLVVCIYKK